jgi:predicted tellurium resistance membrane protein TerC
MNLFLFAKQFVDMLYPYQGLDYIMVFIALYMIGYQLILVRPNIVHKSTSQDYALALIAIILSVHFLFTRGGYHSYIKVSPQKSVFFAPQVRRFCQSLLPL